MPTKFSSIKINNFPVKILLIFCMCRKHIAIAEKWELVGISSWKYKG